MREDVEEKGNNADFPAPPFHADKIPLQGGAHLLARHFGWAATV
ncbi:hypothetical protein [Mesorhizobium amorphae]|nr:hypothetical protein [Mesorhizobium amorphae]